MNYDNEIEKLATALAEEAMDKSDTYNTAIDVVSDLTCYDDLIVIAEGMIKERAFASVIDHKWHDDHTTNTSSGTIGSARIPSLKDHIFSGDTI